MPSSTSPLGQDLSVAGLLLNVDNGSSPDAFQTIANVSNLTVPMVCKTVDVTNIGNEWEAMAPTIHSMGKINFKIFYIPEEVTHRNSPTVGSIGAGLMWLFLNANAANQVGLRNWEMVFPDGNGTLMAWQAFVTSFSLDAKVGGVFEASMELTNNGTAPSLP
ncbi:MAG: hypothetical protein WA618_11355 [Terriglobales bacterium]